jgi:hypothetical protein
VQKTLVALAILGFAASPVRADWQYTKWGMTKEEVIASSSGVAALTRPLAAGEKPRSCTAGDRGFSDSGIAGAEAPYEAGEFKFKACFFFDKGGKLNGVELGLDVGQDEKLAKPLYETLFGKYGAPEKDYANAVLRVADWRREGNRITYWHSTLGVTLVFYRPLVTPEANGL